MRVCSRCKDLKLDDDFHVMRSRKSLQSWCKDCKRTWDRLYRMENPVRKKKLDQRRNEQAIAARKLIAELKSVPCADCGGRFPTCCMDFDHVNGIKKFNVATLVGYGPRAVLEESRKCEIVCANCHRIRTYLGRTGVG